MGFFDNFKKNSKNESIKPKYVYDKKDLKEVDDYIAKTFGNFYEVFHEIVSPDIHLDVCFVPPTDEEPFYKLVTLGAGAYEMNVPDRWKDCNLQRAEYVMYVPKEWNLKSDDMKDYWPIKVLKDVARLPIICDTWLTFNHTVQADEYGNPYAPNARFNSVVLDFCENRYGDVRLETSSGKTIQFYQVIPLYPEELKYKMENPSARIFDMFAEQEIDCKVVDINRKALNE